MKIQSARQIANWLAGALYAVLLAIAPFSAWAENVLPYEFLPYPNGTNRIDVDLGINHFDTFQYTSGTNVPNTHYNEFSSTLHYVRYLEIAGHPAGIQIFQSVGLATGLEFGGSDVGNSHGVGQAEVEDTVLSAFFWPYADPAGQAYLYTGAYLSVPDGTYRKHNNFDNAYPGWTGDVQIAAFKGIGPNFSLEGAFDAIFSSDTAVVLPTIGTRSVTPTYSLQVWANWDWGNGLRTSLGYLGQFGGQVAINNFNDFRSNDLQRIRAAVSYWWTPNTETLLELAHDVVAPGGYGIGIGATLQVKVLF
jgi:hypothetical protein